MDQAPTKGAMTYEVLPFIGLTVAMVALTGFTLSYMERSVIMNNWPAMRCNVLVMFASYYFKPPDDPRTEAQFATDNFQFCMKSLVHEVTEAAMAPFQEVFGSHASIAGVMTEMLNAIREIIHAIYEAFLSFIEPFLKRFENVVYQLSATTQHLKAAFQRVNAMALSMVFSGLTMIKGLQNAIDFIIKVVMIILVVLVVLIILLFFVLFPFIPLILSVIAVIVATASASVAAAAGGMQGTFCFTPDTRIVLETGEVKPISDLVLGERLSPAGGTVTGILTLDGQGEPLYDLSGIRVSGSHLVQGPSGEWHSVEDDARAVLTQVSSPVLYCLNTTTHVIPVMTADNHGAVLFRDWEEMDEDDEEAHKGWTALVSDMLGGVDEGGGGHGTFSLMDPKNIVFTGRRGIQAIEDIELGDEILALGDTWTRVIGIVEGTVTGTFSNGWMTSCIEASRNHWKRVTTLADGTASVRGKHLITDRGVFRVVSFAGYAIVRDFTEVGADKIGGTYSFVASSLR